MHLPSISAFVSRSQGLECEPSQPQCLGPKLPCGSNSSSGHSRGGCLGGGRVLEAHGRKAPGPPRKRHKHPHPLPSGATLLGSASKALPAPEARGPQARWSGLPGLVSMLVNSCFCFLGKLRAECGAQSMFSTLHVSARLQGVVMANLLCPLD